MALYICSAVEQALDWTKHCSIVKWQDWITNMLKKSKTQPSFRRTELQNIRFIMNQVSDLDLKICTQKTIWVQAPTRSWTNIDFFSFYAFQIYTFVMEKFPYYRVNRQGLKEVFIRQCLSFGTKLDTPR